MKQNLIYPGNWNLLNQLQNEMANLMHDRSKIVTGQWVPSVDIHEESNTFVVLADLPGVNLEDIEITMENSILTIKGERKSKVKIEETNYMHVERMTGSFYRRFGLPDTANEVEMKVELSQGVLKITILKKEK